MTLPRALGRKENEQIWNNTAANMVTWTVPLVTKVKVSVKRHFHFSVYVVLNSSILLPIYSILEGHKTGL